MNRGTCTNGRLLIHTVAEARSLEFVTWTNSQFSNTRFHWQHMSGMDSGKQQAASSIQHTAGK